MDHLRTTSGSEHIHDADMSAQLPTGADSPMQQYADAALALVCPPTASRCGRRYMAFSSLEKALVPDLPLGGFRCFTPLPRPARHGRQFNAPKDVGGTKPRLWRAFRD